MSVADGGARKRRWLLRGVVVRPASVLLVLLVTAWCLLNGLWLRQDHLLRDGDEEGHVGAAELVAAAWSGAGPVAACEMALGGDLGEYPPLYAGVVGVWWALQGGGDPGRPAVRGVNLLWPLIAALAVGWLALPLGQGAALVAAMVVLGLPLLGGLGRHFMPEGALTAAVCLCMAALALARRRPGWCSAVALGVALGMALLVKQTAVIHLLLPVLLFLPRSRTSVATLGTAGLLVGQWALPLLAEQWGYAMASASGPGNIPVTTHLLFYLRSLWWVGAGPALLAAALLGMLSSLLPWRVGSPVAPGCQDRWLVALAWAWLVGGLLLLTLLPRKYPRLMAPALPALGLMVALGWARGGWWCRGVAVGLLAGAAWWGLGSWRGLPVPVTAETLDERCAQRWFRPPVEDDFGIGAVVAAAAGRPYGPVLVLAAPEIPCQIQTTFDWDAHLGPALRRGGVDRPVIQAVGDEPPTLVVAWGTVQDPPGQVLQRVEVPALGSFRIIVPLAARWP